MEQKLNNSTTADVATSSHTNGNTMLLAVVSSKLRPILFSTEMVKAILEGRKTQTRRLLKLKGCKIVVPNKYFDMEKILKWNKDYFPYGKIGDILWVRETWQKSLNPNEFVYKADTDNPIYLDSNFKWKPSIFMPYAACRIFLKVTNIRVEKLQDISETDAINEGIEIVEQINKVSFYKRYFGRNKNFTTAMPKYSYQTLWEKINGKESWDLNPYVWVIEFERCSKP